MNITLQDLYKIREEMYVKSRGIIAAKGHDYNREFVGSNHLFNIFVCEILGIVDRAERGLLVRMSDKFMRIISLWPIDVTAQVLDEKLDNTIADMHNYLDYLLLIRRKRYAFRIQRKSKGRSLSVSARLSRISKRSRTSSNKSKDRNGRVVNSKASNKNKDL